MLQQITNAVPVGAKLSYGKPVLLGGWRSQGTYTVDRVTKDRVFLATHPDDFGSVLLDESAVYLDHATEHQASMLSSLISGGWTSPAWQVVTCYYWSYFLVTAVTRLLGETAWFLDGKAMRELVALGPPGSKGPGAGTFRVSCRPSTYSASRDVELRKHGGRVHDEMWRIWFGHVARLSAGTRGSSLTERAFIAQKKSSDLLGADWPSAIRNLVNYRAGHAYDAVRGAGFCGLGPLVTSDAYDFSDVVSAFESSVVQLRSNVGLEKQMRPACRALVELAIILSVIADNLHAELLDRIGFDKRWGLARRKFRKAKGLSLASGVWPCEAATVRSN